MATEADLLGAFEVHSPAGIEEALAGGVSPLTPIDGKRPVDGLIEGYLRSGRFADCLRVLIAAGAEVGDPLLQTLLLDDVETLRALLAESPSLMGQRISVLTAFTCCRNVTPLHICAEFNCTQCGRLLIDSGAEVDAASLVDADGLGGQTPLFHAVNGIFNYCRPMMEMLVTAGASLEVRVPMVLWGEAMPWETIVFDATPVSYAQCGMFRQFHREERAVYDNIAYLVRARDGSAPPERNVPNRYLR